MKHVAFRIVTILTIGLTLSYSPLLIQAGQDSPLLTSLKKLRGEYERIPNDDGYVFNRKPELDAIVSSGDIDRNIRALVTCMDDLIPSNVTLEGKQLPLGIICYEGLTLLIYYEPTTPRGDIALKWAGHMNPTATEKQMRTAKKAWTKVIKDQSFNKL